MSVEFLITLQYTSLNKALVNKPRLLCPQLPSPDAELPGLDSAHPFPLHHVYFGLYTWRISSPNWVGHKVGSLGGGQCAGKLN